MLNHAVELVFCAELRTDRHQPTHADTGCMHTFHYAVGGAGSGEHGDVGRALHVEVTDMDGVVSRLGEQIHDRWRLVLVEEELHAG